jgi:hypothetical protein
VPLLVEGTLKLPPLPQSHRGKKKNRDDYNRCRYSPDNMG